MDDIRAEFEKRFPESKQFKFSEEKNTYLLDYNADENTFVLNLRVFNQWVGYQAATEAARGGEPKITSEMKIECIGEFSWQEEAPYYDEDGELHDHIATHVVPWDICKDIYKRMAMLAPKAHPPAPVVPEGWSIEHIDDPQSDGYLVHGPGINHCVWKDKEAWLYLFLDSIVKAAPESGQ